MWIGNHVGVFKSCGYHQALSTDRAPLRGIVAFFKFLAFDFLLLFGLSTILKTLNLYPSNRRDYKCHILCIYFQKDFYEFWHILRELSL